MQLQSTKVLPFLPLRYLGIDSIRLGLEVASGRQVPPATPPQDEVLSLLPFRYM